MAPLRDKLEFALVPKMSINSAKNVLTLTQSSAKIKNSFYKLNNPTDLAKLLQINYKTLVFYLYRTNEKDKYSSFEIPKKTGDPRIIQSPMPGLKIIQQKLNQVLQAIYTPKNSAHGFIKNKSILTNAERHVRRRYVINLDLENFFESINFGRVRGMFMSYPYNMTTSVSTVLAQICCFKNSLPQGAPTSPIVSNMICAKMDDQLRRLAESYRCEYSRYADDITISTSLKNIPKPFLFTYQTGVAPGETLVNLIEENGFKLNLNKFRLNTRYERQSVTGITTNLFTNVNRKLIKEVRAYDTCLGEVWPKEGTNIFFNQVRSQD